jgi:hypothetical protein
MRGKGQARVQKIQATIPTWCAASGGDYYYILNPDDYLHEPPALFILLYCLGMLSRYHPDLWMDAITSNVQVAEIVDTLLNVFYRKFPNLILDQLTLTHHHVRLG